MNMIEKAGNALILFGLVALPILIAFSIYQSVQSQEEVEARSAGKS